MFGVTKKANPLRVGFFKFNRMVLKFTNVTGLLLKVK